MTNAQKGMFFVLLGIVMAMGTVGGIEANTNLISMDGVYLAAFATIALGLMALGSSYITEDMQ